MTSIRDHIEEVSARAVEHEQSVRAQKTTLEGLEQRRSELERDAALVATRRRLRWWFWFSAVLGFALSLALLLVLQRRA